MDYFINKLINFTKKGKKKLTLKMLDEIFNELEKIDTPKIINPTCSMLVNENKYINGDTIGGFCHNEAKYSDGKYFYCEHCLKKILNGNDENITKPNSNCVEEWLRFKSIFS